MVHSSDGCDTQSLVSPTPGGFPCGGQGGAFVAPGGPLWGSAACPVPVPPGHSHPLTLAGACRTGPRPPVPPVLSGLDMVQRWAPFHAGTMRPQGATSQGRVQATPCPDPWGLIYCYRIHRGPSGLTAADCPDKGQCGDRQWAALLAHPCSLFPWASPTQTQETPP